jgi:hypothetical protein
VNKREARIVALVCMASEMVLGKMLGDEALPEADQRRLQEESERWGWETLNRYGFDEPFVTVADAFAAMRARRTP